MRKCKMQDAKIETLISIISIYEKTIDLLLVKCDDNEQYIRGAVYIFMVWKLKKRKVKVMP